MHLPAGSALTAPPGALQQVQGVLQDGGKPANGEVREHSRDGSHGEFGDEEGQRGGGATHEGDAPQEKQPGHVSAFPGDQPGAQRKGGD